MPICPSDFISTESLTFEPGRIYVVSGKDIDVTLDLLNSAATVIGDALVYDSRYATPYYLKHVYENTPERQSAVPQYALAYNGFAYDSIAPEGFFVVRGTSSISPDISQIVPNTGSLSGGTSISIYGSNLSAVTAIKFDGILGTSLAFHPAVGNTPEYLTVTTPAMIAIGSVDVLLLVNDKQALLYEDIAINTDMVILVANQFDPADAKQNFLNSGIIVDTMLDLFYATNVLSSVASSSRRYGITRELWPFISRVYFYDQSAICGSETGSIIRIKPTDQDGPEQLPERPVRPGLITSVTITQPTSSTVLFIGSKYNINWASVGIPVGVDIALDLYDGDPDSGGVLQYHISPSGSGLGYNAPNSGTFLWQVNEAPAGSNYWIKIATVASPLVQGTVGPLALA